jgi:two-component system chemotaxis sensor kinase CheA
MDREALSEHLMATFLGEIEEHVQTMARELLAIENDPESLGERLPVVFRGAHSLKGAARAVNLAPIERVSHALETVLGAVREGQRTLDADLTERCLSAIRALDDAARRLRVHEDLLPGPLEDVLPVLTLTETPRTGTARARRIDTSGAKPLPPAEAVTDRQAAPGLAPVKESLARVSTDTLDRLLADSGELSIARRHAAAEWNELATLHEDVRALRVGWRRIVAPLRRLLRSDPRALSRRASGDVEHTDVRLKTLEHRLDRLLTRARTAGHALDRAAAAVENDVRQTRLVRFSEACEGLALAARDPSLPSEVRFDVIVEGGDVLLGRSVLDDLRAPLVQLVRNAAAHGGQPANERAALGKPPRGRIVVSAMLHGDTVHIAVSDDGRGLDHGAIAETARRRGLPAPPTIDSALSLIFQPGFSTSLEASALSGRGVGLDIVRHQTDAMQGHVEASTEPNGGLRVTMRVPATLSTFRALFIKEAGQTFAIPLSGIRRLTRAGAADFTAVGGRDMLVTPDGPVPTAHLARVLNLDTPVRSAIDRVPLVLLRSGRDQVALAVQELLVEEEILSKPLGPRLQKSAHFSGATILPSGQVALILNTARIVQTALAAGNSTTVRPPTTAVAPRSRRHRIILADDSVTTRTLERSILETAGYTVTVAADGAQAWNLLLSDGADLVVADVEMPRMDGLALCEAIRESRRFHQLPVVLVTGVESEAARRRGLDAGADAYLPKSSFDQHTLLDTVRRLLR